MINVEICLVFNTDLDSALLRFLSSKNNLKTFNFNNSFSDYLDTNVLKFDEIFETISNCQLLITDFNDEKILKKFYNDFTKFLENKNLDKAVSWLDFSVCSSDLSLQISNNNTIDFIEGTILNLTKKINQGILILSGTDQSSEIIIGSCLPEFFVESIYLGKTFSSKFYKKAFLISVAGNAMALAEAINYCKIKNLDFNKALEIIGQGAGSSVFLQLFGNTVISKNFKPENLSVNKLIKEYEILINESNVNINVVTCFKECLEELEDKNLGIESIVNYYVNKNGNDI